MEAAAPRPSPRASRSSPSHVAPATRSRDAGTNGSVGPNLDQLKPDKARVQSAIENGGAGTGAMPANIVTGEEAEAVATYVASVAGK